MLVLILGVVTPFAFEIISCHPYELVYDVKKLHGTMGQGSIKQQQ